MAYHLRGQEVQGIQPSQGGDVRDVGNWDRRAQGAERPGRPDQNGRLQTRRRSHVPDVPVNIISHKKLEKVAGWHHVPPADKRTRTLGGLCDCHGEQLAYFRYFDYSNHTAIFQDRHLIPGTKEAPDEVVVPSCAPQGYTLGESTSQNTVLNLPGPLQVRWVTWREEDQKTATSH